MTTDDENAPKIEHVLVSGKDALQPENILKFYEMLTGKPATEEMQDELRRKIRAEE